MMVKIFVNGSVSNLEGSINAWLASEDIIVKAISYTIDVNQNFYSALVYYILKPDIHSLMKSK